MIDYIISFFGMKYVARLDECVPYLRDDDSAPLLALPFAAVLFLASFSAILDSSPPSSLDQQELLLMIAL